MSNTKTGNKGFVNPVDGKVYTIDSVAPGAPGANETPADFDPGSVAVDNTVKDISTKTRVTLGTYLSKVTKGEVGGATVPNKYPVDLSTPASPTPSLTTNGYPSPLVQSSNSAQFKQVLPSSYSGDYSPASQGIKKGLAPGPGSDGHVLLPNATVGNSKALVPNGPIEKYTQDAIEPNRWSSAGPGFTDGADPSAPPPDFTRPLQSQATATYPSEEATLPPAAAFELDYATAVKKAETVTAVNKFKVDVADDPTPASAVATTTNGVPSPLTPLVATDGTFVDSSQLNSYTDDYTVLNEGGPDGLQKGKTGVQGPDGHELLRSVEVTAGSISAPQVLVDYTAASLEPNYRTPGAEFTYGDDPFNPPRDFDPNLQSTAEPGRPSFSDADYTLNLAQMVKKPAADTSAAGNAYPVSEPDLTSLASTSSPDGKYPSPLTPPSNVNATVHAPNIESSMSDAFPTAAGGIIKGKVPAISALTYDGNELLSDITESSTGRVSLNDPLKKYTDEVLSKNELNPDVRAFPPEVDVSSPPADYYRSFTDVNDPGKYTGATDTTELTLGVKLSDPNAVSLRKFPSQQTEKLNDFPVDGNVGGPLTATSDSKSGVAPPLTRPEDINKNYYTKGIKSVDQKFSTQADVPNMGKGRKQDEPYNGNNTLNTYEGNLSVAAVADKIKTYMEKTPTGEAVSRGVPLPTKNPPDHPVETYKGSRGSDILRLGNNRFAMDFSSRLGVSSKFNPTLKLPDGRDTTTLAMAQVGPALSQRAAGELPGILDVKFNPNSATAEGAALLPGAAQAGILKIDNLKLEARDAYDHLDLKQASDGSFTGEFPEDSLTSIAAFGGQSWGTMTNVSEWFEDPASGASLSILMILLILAVRLLIEAFGAPSNISQWVKREGQGPTDVPSDPTTYGKLTLGKYFFKPASTKWGSVMPDWYEVFGVRPTVNQYGEAIRVGTNSFFIGGDKTDVGLGDLLVASVGVNVDSIVGVNSPLGANLVVCRTILRSGLILAEEISKIAKSPNFVAGIRGGLGLLKMIRSSKIISAVNVFSALGDAIIERTKGMKTDANGKPMTLTSIDAAAADKIAFSSMVKHRMSDESGYDPTLTWSSYRAPSMYLTSPVLDAFRTTDAESKKLGAFLGAGALPKKTKTVIIDGKPKNIPIARVYNRRAAENPSRISKTDLAQMESNLDAEYIPFSFQDVRTNELLSFHAFLTAMSDGYSSSYDTVEGIGRIEPVKIYKNTVRKISLSFIIASTNEDDADHMWFKINKLVTMVYPQFNRGKELAGKDYQFTAPFSQRVGAAPLVRIRLGDLLSSNYSRFALARLFGLDSGAANLPDTTTPGATKRIRIGYEEKARQEKEEAQKRFEERKKVFNVGQEVELTNQHLIDGLKSQIESQRKLQTAVESFKTNILNPFLSRLSSSTSKAVEDIPQTDVQTVKITIGDLVSNETASGYRLKVKIGNEEFSSDNIYHAEDLKLADSEIEKIKAEEFPQTQDIDVVHTFMDPKNNPLVKSFESAGGRGLAGFIESMDFDWLNQTTWDTKIGRRAPKMCKINISFAPIHDIVPGLDHRGYNRAPVYPVGSAMMHTSRPDEAELIPTPTKNTA